MSSVTFETTRSFYGLICGTLYVQNTYHSHNKLLLNMPPSNTQRLSKTQTVPVHTFVLCQLLLNFTYSIKHCV